MRMLPVLSAALLLSACTGSVSGLPERPEPPTTEELQTHAFCEVNETKVSASFSVTADYLLELCQPETGDIPAILRLRERRTGLVLGQRSMALAVPEPRIHWYLDGYVTYADDNEEVRFEVPAGR